MRLPLWKQQVLINDYNMNETAPMETTGFDHMITILNETPPMETTGFDQ